MKSFPQLYRELTVTDPVRLLHVGKQVYKFAPEELFDKAFPKPCILQSTSAANSNAR